MMTLDERDSRGPEAEVADGGLVDAILASSMKE